MVRIRAGNTTNPTGTIIATLTNPATFTANAVNTFTAPVNTVLSANTTYWLHFVPNGKIRVGATTSDNESGAMGWSIGNASRAIQRGTWVSTSCVIEFAINGQANPPPPAPTGLTATAGDRQVTLSWSDPSNSTISKYQYRQGSGLPLVYGSWTDITNSDASTTSHTVTSLTNSTEYSFQVRAVAGTLTGTESATVTATPFVPEITITSGTAVTEGTAASFTVRASPVPASNLTVNLTVAEATGSNFVTSDDEGMKMVMIPASSGSVTYTVATADDNMDESNGSVTVTVANGTGYTVGSTASATVMVNDDDEEDGGETPLGVEDAEEAVIFPNPSGDYLEVWSSTRGTFKILSLSGKPLLEGSTNTRIDIASLQSGLYLVQLPDGRLLKFVRE